MLIGIGETRYERIEALLALRRLARDHGHIQEIIIQNFRAKRGTKMHSAPEPDADELCWTIAAARLIHGAAMSIQAPPNLYPGDLVDLVRAGINDWGGVSPVTPDHVNPEAPWPHLDRLDADTGRAGFDLVERLTVYPRYIARRRLAGAGSHRRRDAPGRRGGLGAGRRMERGFHGTGEPRDLTEMSPRAGGRRSDVVAIVDRMQRGEDVPEAQIAALFAARSADFMHISARADALRAAVVGDTVTYAVVRNINYTNICQYKCGFCAFSKGKTHAALRGAPYMLDRAELQRRVLEAWARGATEVCMQGGIHPAFTGRTYLDIVRAAKEAVPAIHVHAFSPWRSGMARTPWGSRCVNIWTNSKPSAWAPCGHRAEILDDDIRRQLAPDKITTEQWLEVIRTAHLAGLPTTSTIMFGHLEGYVHWARHLLRLRALQRETGGFTEFVPLPFVHMEAPLYLRGRARKGPTLREAILMHAVARLALHPGIPNIQASWTKLGPAWAQRCLQAGSNDLGGTLMNESISRAAGASHGQEFDPPHMEELIRGIDRQPSQRTTLYRPVDGERQWRAHHARR